MDRNTIIAIVLSVIVITVGMGIQTAFFAPEMPMPTNEGEVIAEIDASLPEASGGFSAVGADPDPTPFTVAAGAYEIEFDPRGASVSSIRLTEHLDEGEPVEPTNPNGYEHWKLTRCVEQDFPNSRSAMQYICEHFYWESKN